MANSTLLQLPFIEAAQAQKHVTHNDALRVLDAAVQLSVLDRGLTAPPGSPSDGDRYIVASGGSGAWASKDLNIAVWQDGAWAFLVPREGWRCWVEDESTALIWDGAAWRPFLGSLTPNGSSLAHIALEEELAGLSGADDTSTIQIPNGSICFGVSARVTTTITGATSYQVGISGELNKFGDLLGLSAGSTNFGIIGPTAFYADTPIIVTANGSDFTGGAVRLAIHAVQMTPPQS